jgi:hypothetical protein
MKRIIGTTITSRLLMLLLAVAVAGGFSSCKSQKKIAAQKAAAERAAMIEQAKQDLLLIINDQGNMTIGEKEDKVAEIVAMDLQDTEVDALIERAQQAIEKQKAEMQRQEEERLRKEREAQQQEEQKFDKLEDIFDRVAGSKSMEMSNRSIEEALRQFSSPDVPVLIIVFMDDEITDYDKPTTIRKYLEYLKDQGKNPNDILNVKFDANGKINELELIKK